MVFDLDGTLVESDEFDGVLYAKAVRDVLNVDVDEDWSGYRHVTDSGILDEILDRHAVVSDHAGVHVAVRDRFTALVEDHLAERKGCLPEVPGAAAFVKRLLARPGVVVAVATGGWRQTAAMKLQAIGLDPRELRLSSASDAVSRVEIMRHAERRAMVARQASRRFYFGNQPWDREASRSLGWEFVGIGAKVVHSLRFDDFLASETLLAVLKFPTTPVQGSEEEQCGRPVRSRSALPEGPERPG